MRLGDDIVAVVEKLGLDIERQTRRKLYCFSPWNGHHNAKLEIEIEPRAGKWNDWIEGQYGDALSLVACVLARRCVPKDRAMLGEAMNWARRYFGIEGERFDAADFEKASAEARARAERRQAQAARELTRQRSVAKGLWLAASPLSAEDVGGKYLAARGIDLKRLPRMPRAIRVSPAQQWYDDAGEIGHVGPALMSAMTLPLGDFASLHRIWIDPGRPGQKADLKPPRKMWPASEGAAIRLWRGESGKSEKDAAKAGLLEDVIVCEGVEDGLSIALMTPELRVIAVGSLPGLLSYVPPKVARRVIVAADNDWGKAQAEAILNRACERLVREFGKSVSIARSPEGKDFNDLLRGVE